MFYAIIFLIFADKSVELHMLDRALKDPFDCELHLMELIEAIEPYAEYGYAECKHIPQKTL